MRSDTSKVLHAIAGLPLVMHVARACESLLPQKIVVVVSADGKDVAEAIAPLPTAIQAETRGTADAVKAAQSELKDFNGDIVVLYGDSPLVTAADIQILRDKRQATKAAIVVAGFTPDDPASYGRLVFGADGRLDEIVEAKDATPEQKNISLCNGGMMLFDAATLWSLLDKVTPDNAKNEYYLTDCVKLARQQGLTCAVADVSAEAVLGVNTRVDLAEAERRMQQRLRRAAMLGGVTMIDPDTVYLSADTVFGCDVVVGPHVVFAPGVRVSDGVEIRSFCHIAGTRIETGSIVGPFARLRPNTFIGTGGRIGNFVEIKNSEIGAGAKVNHLSYLGDAIVGSRANIGAGTITCNYDGYRKARTDIGAGAFIGSITALVAPVSVGSGAYVGAGSVITENVSSDALSVARGKQTSFPDWARRYREGNEKDSMENEKS
jgi:bifunctional UDP-N-acetylglucosamine pyrophosphorylase/glucosamine-1-phosphate N-acetyltransferase